LAGAGLAGAGLAGAGLAGAGLAGAAGVGAAGAHAASTMDANRTSKMPILTNMNFLLFNFTSNCIVSGFLLINLLYFLTISPPFLLDYN